MIYDVAAWVNSRHNRWYGGEDRAWIGEGQDWSGVGTRGTQWATLVAPHWVICADHWHPPVGSTITWWTGNSKSEVVTSTIVWGLRSLILLPGNIFGHADIWMGLLDSAPPVKIYPMFRKVMVDYDGIFVYSMGWYQNDKMCLGVRQIKYVPTAMDSFLVFKNMLTDNPDSVYASSGDSGSPTMAVVNGELAFLGTHFASSADGASCQHVDMIHDVIAQAPDHSDEKIRIVEDVMPALGIDRDGVSWPVTAGQSVVLQHTNDLLGEWEDLETFRDDLGSICKVKVPLEGCYRLRRE